MRFLLTVLLFLCSFFPLSYAIEEDAVIAPNASQSESAKPGSGDVLSGYSVVIVYLVLFSAVAVIVWQYSKTGRLPGKRLNEEGIKITETKALGNKQFLVVAEYEEKRYMLGVGPGFIQKISDLEPLAESPVADFVEKKEEL